MKVFIFLLILFDCLSINGMHNGETTAVTATQEMQDSLTLCPDDQDVSSLEENQIENKNYLSRSNELSSSFVLDATNQSSSRALQAADEISQFDFFAALLAPPLQLDPSASEKTVDTDSQEKQTNNLSPNSLSSSFVSEEKNQLNLRATADDNQLDPSASEKTVDTDSQERKQIH